MPLEEFRIQIAMLMDAITNQPEDMHEAQESLREKLMEMQSLGLPLPADLVDLEKYLKNDFDNQGDDEE